MKNAAILCLLSGSLSAWGGTTNNWGVSAGDWNVGGNWNPSGPPTALDRANIDNGGTATISADAACTNIYLGSTTGTTGALAITAGTLSVWKDMSVGYGGGGGMGTVTQSGGTNQIMGSRYIQIGKAAGGSGYYHFDGGEINGSQLYVGWSGYGEFQQNGGNLIVTQGIVNFIIGTGSTGLYVQSNGTVRTAGISVGAANGAGTYQLVNGTLFSSANTYVATGTNSSGRVRMTGGSWTMYNQNMTIGNSTNSVGEFDAIGGSLIFTNTATKTLYVGSYGTAALYLGDSNTTAIVTNLNNPGVAFGSFAVRDQPSSADGLVRGWGIVGFRNELRNNGRVIADGYGTDRDLNLSLFATVTNSLANTSSNGWYAQNHGRLQLPSVPVFSNAATAAYSWGDYRSNATLTLVNSARLAFSNSRASSLTGALLSPDRADVPAGLTPPIGVWNFASTGAFSAVTLTLRYDDAQAAVLGLSSNTLRVWQSHGAGWADVTQTVDTNALTVTTAPVSSLGVFAIAAAQKGVGSVVQVR